MIKIFISVLVVSVLLFANENNQTKWETQDISKEYKIEYDKNTTCLVRHLKLYKHPKWVAKIEVGNGKVVYFCSPKSMFEFYFQPGKWYEIGVKKEEDFKKIIVTDFNTLKPINAKKAYFVYGSKVISPAGDDLVAFSSKKDAKEFVREYGGTRIFSFDEVKYGLIKWLNNAL